jgi:hypothetical protein
VERQRPDQSSLSRSSRSQRCQRWPVRADRSHPRHPPSRPHIPRAWSRCRNSSSIPGSRSVRFTTSSTCRSRPGSSPTGASSPSSRTTSRPDSQALLVYPYVKLALRQASGFSCEHSSDCGSWNATARRAELPALRPLPQTHQQTGSPRAGIARTAPRATQSSSRSRCAVSNVPIEGHTPQQRPV